MYVTTDMGSPEQKLLSVDGVDISCLLQANPGTDGEVVAIDIMQVLDFASGASPKAGSEVVVQTVAENGDLNTRKSAMTYARLPYTNRLPATESGLQCALQHLCSTPHGSPRQCIRPGLGLGLGLGLDLMGRVRVRSNGAYTHRGSVTL